MTVYTISHLAYLKVASHASKYPHKQVNGVLVGKSAGNDAVEVVDAIPLLHHWTSLSPSMEIGLDLARNHVQSIGMHLVGYYQASERLDDTALAPVGERVAETLRAGFPQAIAFVVDGRRLASSEPALLPYLPVGQGTSWRPAGQDSDTQHFSGSSNFRFEDTSSPSRVLETIRAKGLHQMLGDFDDHLEDVSIDWLRNKQCNDAA